MDLEYTTATALRNRETYKTIAVFEQIRKLNIIVVD